MSAISITPQHVVGGPATRLRLTARGRRVLALLVALPLAAGITAAALNGASAVASSAPFDARAFDTVTVLPGDTLWALATQIAPTEDPRRVVDALVRLNMLGDGAVFVGQELAIPHEYSVAGH